MAKKTKVEEKKFNTAYVLLDRTGSMFSMWEEAIGAINTYIDKLENDVKIYLSCFDSESFDVLREDVKKNVKKVKLDEITPRACTPLYDAAAKVMHKMLADNPDRAVFVVMTDGCENASVEYNLSQVKKLMKKIEKKDWPSVMLGANFKDVEKYATQTFGYDVGNTAFSTTKHLCDTMGIMSVKTSAYFGGNRDAMAWTKEEKESVSKDS